MDNGHTTSTRQQRRAAERLGRKILDRGELLRLAAALAEADTTVSGVTIIQPDGKMSFVDAGLLRRGGGRA